MRDFPSCFGENGVQVADASSNSSKTSQNLVNCLYSAELSGRSCVISITWSRNMMGQGLNIGVDDSKNKSLCRVDIKPWLFSKRRGSKTTDAGNSKVDVFWDLTNAKFGSGPEPLEGFFVAVLFDLQIVLLLGDLVKEAHRRTNATPPASNALLLAKREHIFGKKVYSTKAQLRDRGRVHEIMIQSETAGSSDPCLEIRIDKKRVMQVKHLLWKFRGNQTILVDGLPVEVFWDVHNWLFDASTGNAVFMFQSSASTEKTMPSQGLRESELRPVGFSLILYAWKND
ncbi:hypothetical protein HPP92_007770 [Vanilla planifolia]|uniref:DUF868 family protein n=1 Tax=Vanilla planifolia TaxID=51239 RepID=A0A835RS17_VANPL|nr:hypothetical protein HPP92_007925 [Vanilla planifolia]KAG0490907.1 hypothetical protein HPP92_007770 [Vanilla planifolia]